MSYDLPDPEPYCVRCNHVMSKHKWIGQPGYTLGGPVMPRFGRCEAKKCVCWKFKEAQS